MKSVVRLLTILFISLIGLAVQAKIYDRHIPGNTDVIYVREAIIEVLLKEKLIESAKHEIMIVQHEHQPDFFGNRMTVALKKAAARGVKVRYIIEKVANVFGGDPFSKTEKYLVSTQGEEIPQVINLGILDRLKSPLPLLALLHTKFLIIDPGTPNETIVTGGRNTSDKYLKWLDAGFILRPVNPGQKYIGDDIIAYFNGAWEALLSYDFQPLKPVKMSSSTSAMLSHAEESFKAWQAPADVKPKLQEITNVLSAPATEKVQLPYQFRPASSVLVTNDLLVEQVNLPTGGKKWVLAGKKTQEQYERSDNLAVVSHLLKDAKVVYLSSFTFSPPPMLLNTIKDIASRGVPLLVFTNDENSFMSAFKDNAFMSLGAASKSRRFFNKLDLTEEEKKNAQIYVFNPDLTRSTKQFEFLHRKMIVTDRWVITGSDNFSYASIYYCDEAILLFEDGAMSRYMIKEQMAEVRDTFKLNPEMTLKNSTTLESLQTFFFSLLEPVFYDIVL